MAELTREEVLTMVEEAMRERKAVEEEVPEPPSLPEGIEGTYVLAAREEGA